MPDRAGVPLPRGLVVSCQGAVGTPLDDPRVMAAMAVAAVAAGAVAIRAQGVADIRRIREAVDVPIIGLIKRVVGDERRITLTIREAVAAAEAGADIVAVESTDRPREDGLAPAEHLRLLVAELDRPVMADVATLQEGIDAEAAGAHLVGSTMSGYTRSSPRLPGPDLALVADLVAALRVPVVAEGRYHTPADVAEAFARGAHAVVVGTAITNPLEITRWFVAAVPGGPAGTHGTHG
jgi:N-acylglucosamine-6-phosphate 2-epimerase